MPGDNAGLNIKGLDYVNMPRIAADTTLAENNEFDAHVDVITGRVEQGVVKPGEEEVLPSHTFACSLPCSPRAMPSGTMKRWNTEKGFGFIQPSDGGEDLFCHVSSLLDGEGSCQEGDKVRFKITFDDRKGKIRATDVTSVEQLRRSGI